MNTSHPHPRPELLHSPATPPDQLEEERITGIGETAGFWIAGAIGVLIVSVSLVFGLLFFDRVELPLALIGLVAYLTFFGWPFWLAAIEDTVEDAREAARKPKT